MSAKPTGLNWGAVTEQYVAAGGELQPEVWKGAVPGVEKRPSRPGGAHRNRIPKGVPPGKPRTLTDAQEQEVAKRYAEGEGSPSLAKAYNLSPATIRKIVQRQGGEVRAIKQAIWQSRVRNPLTEAEEASVVERYAAGESAEQMGKEFGVLPVTLRRMIVRRGGTIRTRAEATRLAKEAKRREQGE